MKTISVRETAEALGISTRAVQYKLQNGDLKGTRTKNQFGVQEWRVYPTKEIAEAVTKKQGSTSDAAINFEPIESETVDAEPYQPDITEEVSNRSWLGPERESVRVLAEELVRPLVETIQQQTAALGERDRVIEEQGRQLRLLPDLEKRAEDERKAAEIKALEVEALYKQIAALEETKSSAIEAERRTAEEAAEKTAELAKEIERLKSANEAVTSKLERLEQPWWKKWFAAGE